MGIFEKRLVALLEKIVKDFDDFPPRRNRLDRFLSYVPILNHWNAEREIRDRMILTFNNGHWFEYDNIYGVLGEDEVMRLTMEVFNRSRYYRIRGDFLVMSFDNVTIL